MTSEERRLSDLFKSSSIENKCTICKKDAPALFHLKVKTTNYEAANVSYISDEYACASRAYEELYEIIAKERED